MKYSKSEWSKLESQGLAMQTGAIYLRASLTDDLIDEALAFDYARLKWKPDLVAVKRNASRGLLWRFAWIDTSGVALRYKSKMGELVHLTLALWEPEVYSLSGFCDCFLSQGKPIGFSKPALRLSNEVGLMMGDPMKGSASLIYVNEADNQIRLVDVVLRTASHSPNDRTTISELSDEDKQKWAKYFAKKLPSLEFLPESRFSGSYQIDYQ